MYDKKFFKSVLITLNVLFSKELLIMKQRAVLLSEYASLVFTECFFSAYLYAARFLQYTVCIQYK